MVRVTCLSPTKSYSYYSSALAHLEILILQSSNSNLLLEAINEQPYKANKKIQLRTLHHNKRKALKEHTKDRGHCYGYESARNAKNGAKMAILWVKW